MSEELRECPFCKAKPISEDRRKFFLKHKPECFLAHHLHNANFNIVSTGSVADHIKAWNTRPAEDALKAENERLKKALKEIIDECQQERVYATEIQGKRFIDEIEQRAKLALTIEESKR